MRWLVCGGRDFGDLAMYRREQHHEPDSWMIRKKEKEYQFILNSIERIATERSIHYVPEDNWLPSDIEIISGMATGVDSVAVDWAISNWCKWHEFPAEWDKYGKKAGYIRNKQMLEEGKPDLVIAFPGGRGTQMMVDLARKANVEVIVINYKESNNNDVS